ncbi:MAG: hypothetical protein A3I09_03270 [Deltaproteobacteria bacterium RIFCSPLOWO2_02_FULL_47_10]|nr:MAG: hypothetical protein A3I09_03270 [Deltaproteobacteria bacterium RIFCSPLOWO2_02_FULL_47_10]
MMKESLEQLLELPAERKPIGIAQLKWFATRAIVFITLIGPDLLLAIVMTAILVSTVAFKGGQIRFFQASLGLPVGIMLFLLIYNRGQKAAHIVRDWLPFLFVTFIYENLHDLSKLFYNHDIAEILHRWDIVIFGIEPTIWAQKFYTPLLTDVMAVSYAMYFIFPLVIMFFLSNDDRRFEFREMALALTFTFIMGFIGYVLWPTSPPRYLIPHLYTNPQVLHGIFIFDRLQGAWDNLSVVPCGAFPSLHVGVSAVALFYAWKFRNIGRIYKWIWYLYIPLVTSLWFSTVYLRHHWVIDIFAGWIVALIGFGMSEYILKAWQKIRSIAGSPRI